MKHKKERGMTTIEATRGASFKLAAQLRRSVTKGEWEDGEKLPPVREIMTLTGLGYATVIRALNELSDEGLLEQRRGAGTFVRYRLQSIDTLGIVVPNWTLNTLSYRIGDMVQGITQYAAARGFRVELLPDLEDASGDFPFVDEALEGKRAVIWIHPQPEHEMNLGRLVDRKVPVVCIGRPPERVPVPTLFPGHRATGKLVADYMREHAKSKHLLLCNDLDDAHTRARIDGLRSELEAAGFALADSQICARGGIATCIEANPDFDLLFAIDSSQLSNFLASTERRCPQDFAVIACAAHAPLHELYTQAPVVAYVTPADLLGRRAVDVLVKVGTATPKKQNVELKPVLIEPQWSLS